MSKHKYVMPGPDPEYVKADQERRRSSAAQKHRNKRKYWRKTKHKGRNDDWARAQVPA